MDNRQPMSAVGTKFHPDGRVRAFPGMSLVSHLRPTVPQYQLLSAFQEEAKKQPFAPYFAFLPPESFHMTVFDLLCDQVRKTENWSSNLPLDAPFAEAEERMVEWLAEAIPGQSLFMLFNTLLDYETTVKPYLMPGDVETAVYLHDLREKVARLTGIRHPRHDVYRFHISTAYQLYELEPTETEELDQFLAHWDRVFKIEFGILYLKEPKLVFFPDMFSFPVEPLFCRQGQ